MNVQMKPLVKTPAGKHEHDDFPVSFRDFASVLVGTPDEIWTRVLASRFGNMKMLHSQWRAALVTVKTGGV
jgi:hypothetical protein